MAKPSLTNYTCIDNTPIGDPALSFEALGLLVYLVSRPPGWVVRNSDIMARGGIGKNKAYRLLRELKEAGYIERKLVWGDTGHYEWVTKVYQVPSPQNREPSPQNRAMGEGQNRATSPNWGDGESPNQGDIINKRIHISQQTDIMKEIRLLIQHLKGLLTHFDQAELVSENGATFALRAPAAAAYQLARENNKKTLEAAYSVVTGNDRRLELIN